MNKYYSLPTDICVAAIANAALIGAKVDISDFVVGDGGGSYYQPTPDMTKLRGQTWKGKVASVTAVENSPNVLRIRAILPSDVGGFTIREMGALNSKGQLLAISNTPDMQKVIIADGVSSELEAVIEIAVSNAEVVSFTVDPTVIIATKKDILAHAADAGLHVTAIKQKTWDSKAAGDHTHTAADVGADPAGSAATAKKEAVEAAAKDATTKVSAVAKTVKDHTDDVVRHLKDGEREGWNDLPSKRHNHSGQTSEMDDTVDGSGGTISYTYLTDKPDKIAPSSHADTHGPDGNDPITPELIGAVSIAEANTFKGDLSKQDSNIIGLALEVEVLKGAALTGVNANIIVESFLNLTDVTLLNGVYDQANKKIYLP